ncbi:hypothetical protein AK830_g5221 [Neonectria ditissima]|uniref:Transglutaminase-like domain-containing protein n=1 Tax=Neonectria ditissima TaxID=78410 RepID=A0A0N8H7B3_9HYPO|nr:hypothetical protein AK830_g5221 [Neonectria ditissima]
MVGSFPSNFVEVLPADFRPTMKSTSRIAPKANAAPTKSKTFRKPFEAYAKAPHYTTAKQPEVLREPPKSRQRQDSSASYAQSTDEVNRAPSPAPRSHGSKRPSPAPSHGDSSRAPSPAPPQGYGSRAPSPAPPHGYVSRAPSPAPPHGYNARAPSPAPPHDYRGRAPSPAPPHDYRGRAPSPTPPHGYDARGRSPVPPHHYIARNPSPAPSFRPQSYRGSQERQDSPPPPPPPPHRHVTRTGSNDLHRGSMDLVRYGSNDMQRGSMDLVRYGSNDMHRGSMDRVRHGSNDLQRGSVEIPRHGSNDLQRRPMDIARQGSNASYGYDVSRQNSHNSYRPPNPPVRHDSRSSFDDRNYIPYTPGAVSPAPPSPAGGMTPSPLREAMDGVMEQLGQLGSLSSSRRIESPEPTADPWSPESFDMVSRGSQRRTQERSRPRTSLGIAHPDEGYETWSGESSQEVSYQSGSRGDDKLSSYVDRMEKRIQKMHHNNSKVDDDDPPPPPPKNVPEERPKSSMGGSVTSGRKLRARKSAYEIGRGIARTYTTKTNATNSSSGNQSNSSSSTQSSARTLWSGASAGAFSSTSAGSLARNGKRAQSALGIRDADADRPETPFTGVTYHSSHASNANTTRPQTQAGFHEDVSAGLGGLVHLGGLVQPKPAKRNIFRKILDTAKTGVASSRGGLVSGGLTGSESTSRSPFARSLPPGSSPASSKSKPNYGRDAAMDMGLSGGVDWIQVRRDINRSNSISRNEQIERRERCQMMDHPALNPVDELYQAVEGDEGADGEPVEEPINYHTISLTQVDKNSRFISGLPSTTTAVTLATTYVCRPFRSDVQRLRAIFTWVSERICWEEDFEGEIDTRRVISSKRGCAEEYAVLVSEMCTAVGIHCEIVRGYLKSPGEVPEINSMPRSNHWWNAVVVDNEWRMIDCCLASPSYPRRGLYSSASTTATDPWWFLTRPLELCWTHIPEHHSQQHIVPPVAHETLLNLPCTSAPFFRNGFEMVDYNTSLNRIEDLEMVHVKFNVPADVEIAAEVEVRGYSRDSDGDLFESGDVVKKRALAQAEWFNGIKRYTVKALLPGDEGQGTLKVYAGKRGLMHSIKDIPHPLAFTLPIVHTGENPPYEFVMRHPTPHAQRHDIYVVQPQCQRLVLNNTFVFAIRQHPSFLNGSQSALTPSSNPGGTSPVPFARPGSSMSIHASSVSGSQPSSASGMVAGKKPAKLAIQTPGGKILRLMRKEDRKGIHVGRSLTIGDDNSDGGTWETIIKCSEKVGMFLVAVDNWEALEPLNTANHVAPRHDHRILVMLGLQPSSYTRRTENQRQDDVVDDAQTDETDTHERRRPRLLQRARTTRATRAPPKSHEAASRQPAPRDDNRLRLWMAFNGQGQQGQQPAMASPSGIGSSPTYMAPNGAAPGAGVVGGFQQAFTSPQQQYYGIQGNQQQQYLPQLQQQQMAQYGGLAYQGYDAAGQAFAGGGNHQMHQQPAAAQYVPVWQPPQQQQHHVSPQMMFQQQYQPQPQPQPHTPQMYPRHVASPQQLQQRQQQMSSPQARPPSLPQQQGFQLPPQPQQQQYQQPANHQHHPQQHQPLNQPQQAHIQQTNQQFLQQPVRHKPAQQPVQPQIQKPKPVQQPVQHPVPEPVPEPVLEPVLEPPPEPISDPAPEPAQPIQHYVNLQDIQQLPPQPMTIPASQSTIAPAALDTIYVQPSQLDNITVTPMDIMLNKAPPPPPKAGSVTPRIKPSPHSSVANSPAFTARSPSITKKSPAIPPKPRPVDTVQIMVAVAEECFKKARSSVHDVAMHLEPARVDEYQNLITTGLACLEASLQNHRLSPRQEARMRLRYAAVLLEETENLMEAETALTKGITLCDKHRLFDLKYCMQYIMLKVLFQRSHKAALNAVDRHISNCEAFKHVHWVYAFKLLKATFYMEVGQTADAGALENIRSIQVIANSRGDNAISAFASILEGLALIKASKDGNVEKVQTCIAQAAKFQFDPSVRIIQLDMLTLLLDLASSINQQSPDVTSQKLRLLQKRLDECGDWHNVKADFVIPVKKQPSTAQTISGDTAAIIRGGDSNEPMDFLVMSFMTKMELTSLVFTFSGLTNLHRLSSSGPKSAEFWREGLKILDAWDTTTSGIRYGPSTSLQEAIRQREWRIEAQAYLNILLGLLAASHCQWDTVKQFMVKLEVLITPSTQSILRLLSVYLSGVYHQGTGDLQAAVSVFRDPCFSLSQRGTGIKAAHREMALLAGLNRLWIMQHPSQRDDLETLDLIEELQPLCSMHPNIDLRTAWHNVMAALVTDPPQQLNQRKQHIQAAMGGSRATNNVLGAAVTLAIMRSRLFENVIGEQALKSAMAAAKQAQRSGNTLWQSVADGMLAHSYEVQGQQEEAAREWDKATREAKEAFYGR